MARTHRFHLDFPTVTTTLAGRRVSFVGATFHSRSVMIEYDIEPLIYKTQHALGPKLLALVVTDDIESTPYPTYWEDFDWSSLRPGRVTTRLDRRPGQDATRMIVSVRTPQIGTTPNGASQYTASDHEVVSFEIDLPQGHASKPLGQVGD